MHSVSKSRLLSLGMALCGLMTFSGNAIAADLPSEKAPPMAPAVDANAPWFVKLGVAGVLFDSSATLTLAGTTVPGASAKASNNVTALIEAGYFINPNFSVQLTGGYPPTSTLSGQGTIASLGTLGKVTYGPAVLSFQYHFTQLGAFRPYFGAGFAYPIIFGTSDGIVRKLNVEGSAGFALEGGVDYYLNKNWSIFAEAKYIFLTVDANGYVGGAPVTARVKLDPTIVSGGIAYHW